MGVGGRGINYKPPPRSDAIKQGAWSGTALQEKQYIAELTSREEDPKERGVREALKKKESRFGEKTKEGARGILGGEESKERGGEIRKSQGNRVSDRGSFEC